MAKEAKAQCCDCGRFLSERDYKEGKHFFEPASHFGPEVSEWVCASCRVLNDARCDAAGWA